MSNIYPEWWSQSITVYNRFEDPQTHVVNWYRSNIDGAFWKYAGNKINIGETVLETNNIICRIRKDDRFLEDYQWQALPNDKMSQYFTLQQGDIIIKGEVDDDIDEYTAGHRSSDFLQKYKAMQGCMTVENVAINVGPGLGQEHYYARGI